MNVNLVKNNGIFTEDVSKIPVLPVILEEIEEEVLLFYTVRKFTGSFYVYDLYVNVGDNKFLMAKVASSDLDKSVNHLDQLYYGVGYECTLNGNIYSLTKRLSQEDLNIYINRIVKK